MVFYYAECIHPLPVMAHHRILPATTLQHSSLSRWVSVPTSNRNREWCLEAFRFAYQSFKPNVTAQCSTPVFQVVCRGVASGFSNLYNWSPAAFTDENLDGGEYFVPGTIIGGATGVTDSFWKEVKEGITNTPDVSTFRLFLKHVAAQATKRFGKTNCTLLPKKIFLGCLFVILLLDAQALNPLIPLRPSRMRKLSCGHSGHFVTGGAKHQVAALSSRRLVGN